MSRRSPWLIVMVLLVGAAACHMDSSGLALEKGGAGGSAQGGRGGSVGAAGGSGGAAGSPTGEAPRDATVPNRDATVSVDAVADVVRDAGVEAPPDAGQRLCGGGNGNCPVGQFCERPDMQCTGVGVCVPVPLICAPGNARVCGCNGITYLNDCLRQMARVSKDGDGAC